MLVSMVSIARMTPDKAIVQVVTVTLAPAAFSRSGCILSTIATNPSLPSQAAERGMDEPWMWPARLMNPSGKGP